MCNQAYPKYPKQEVCISLQYLPKNIGDEVDFLPANKHEVFLQVNTLWVWVARHAQSTQNNKFTISLQHVKENMKNEADFLPADERQSVLQILIL